MIIDGPREIEPFVRNIIGNPFDAAAGVLADYIEEHQSVYDFYATEERGRWPCKIEQLLTALRLPGLWDLSADLGWLRMPEESLTGKIQVDASWLRWWPKDGRRKVASVASVPLIRCSGGSDDLGEGMIRCSQYADRAYRVDEDSVLWLCLSCHAGYSETETAIEARAASSTPQLGSPWSNLINETTRRYIEQSETDIRRMRETVARFAREGRINPLVTNRERADRFALHGEFYVQGRWLTRNVLIGLGLQSEVDRQEAELAQLVARPDPSAATGGDA